MATSIIYYFTVSLSQKSGQGLARSPSSGSLIGCNQAVGWWRPKSHLRAQVEVDLLSKLTPAVVGRIWFHVSCWLEAFLGSLLPGSLHRATHNMASGFIRASKWEGVRVPATERVPARGKWQSFVVVATSHHLCHILLVRSDSLGPAHIQGAGYYRRACTRSWDHWELCQKLCPIHALYSKHSVKIYL